MEALAAKGHLLPSMTVIDDVSDNLVNSDDSFEEDEMKEKDQNLDREISPEVVGEPPRKSIQIGRETMAFIDGIDFDDVLNEVNKVEEKGNDDDDDILKMAIPQQQQQQQQQGEEEEREQSKKEEKKGDLSDLGGIDINDLEIDINDLEIDFDDLGGIDLVGMDLPGKSSTMNEMQNLQLDVHTSNHNKKEKEVVGAAMTTMSTTTSEKEEGEGERSQRVLPKQDNKE